jgi:lipoprotein-anchoring transpeptidase ErfK/SrfK
MAASRRGDGRRRVLTSVAGALAAGAVVCAAVPAGALALRDAATVPTATPVEAPSPAPPGPPSADVTRLSNLRTLTRWAYPLSDTIVRSTPSSGGQAVGRLRFLTVDAQAELYVELAAERSASGARWIEVELPGRPNGKTGWVPEEALGEPHVVHDFLLIDQRGLRASLYRAGRKLFSAPVGVGKPSTVTPAGHFYVLEKLTTLGAPFYGPYAIGTSAYAPTLSEWPGGGVVGIHGTDAPGLVPGRPSHGCIRMRNGDITRLWHMIGLGTPIRIT